MQNGFKVMDSDMHIIEPPDLWQRYIDPALKDQALGAIRTEWPTSAWSDPRDRRGDAVLKTWRRGNGNCSYHDGIEWAVVSSRTTATI